MEKRRVWDVSACAVTLLLAAATLLYYVFGPSLASFHADCTDSLLWAQATVETGDILAADFHYAALLPFGSPLWMVPVLKMFGYTMTAQQISMAIFAVLFLAASFACFRTLRFSLAGSGGATFVLAMLLSSSAKLREIMWEHTIYYSLSILLILVLVPLSTRVTTCLASPGNRRGDLVRLAVWSALLWLICLGCGMDGVQVAAITAVPVGAAWVMQTLFDGEEHLLSLTNRWHYVTVGLMAIGVVCGLMVLHVVTDGGEISAGYENAFSQYDKFDNWTENARHFLPHFLSLCGVTSTADMPFVSKESVFMVIKLVAAWCILIFPFLLLFRYRAIKTRVAKVMVWTHVILSGILLFLFVCGFLSNAEWRLTPLVGSGIITSLLYLRELFDGTCVHKRMAVVLASVLGVAAVLNAVTMWTLPKSSEENRDKISVAATLAATDCTYGYATFWNAQSTTLLSNGKVTVMPIEVESDHWDVYRYQIRDAWLEAYDEQDRVFVMLTSMEYEMLKRNNRYQQLRAEGALVDQYVQDGYHLLIFDRDPFK